MKYNKLVGVFALLFLAIFVLTITTGFASAATEHCIKSGSLQFCTHVDLASIYATDCKKTIPGGHVNLVVKNSAGQTLQNWHIGSTTPVPCILAWDSQNHVCKDYCASNKKIGDLLATTAISNTANKLIQGSSDMIKDFNKIGLNSGASPYLFRVGTFAGIIIGASTLAMIYVIAKAIGIIVIGLLPIGL